MKFQGALVKEQGVTFGIIVVKPHVLNSPSEADSMRTFGVRAFGPVPIILMAQNARGVPAYSGRWPSLSCSERQFCALPHRIGNQKCGHPSG